MQLFKPLNIPESVPNSTAATAPDPGFGWLELRGSRDTVFIATATINRNSIQSIPTGHLDDDQRAEMEAFKHPGRRWQFSTSRLLAYRLAEQVGGRWELALPAGERPTATLNGQPAGISISHTGDLVAVALSNRDQCGIDVEQPSRARDYASLSERMGWPDADSCHFLARWTLWEACGKAVGLGALRRDDQMFNALLPVLHGSDPFRVDNQGAWQWSDGQIFLAWAGNAAVNQVQFVGQNDIVHECDASDGIIRRT